MLMLSAPKIAGLLPATCPPRAAPRKRLLAVGREMGHVPPSLLDTVTCADLFALCGRLPDGSVDMILCDLPYGTTACSWDTVIPFAPMWDAFKRVIKPRGAIVLTASQPFTSALVMSNPKMFRYEWIWEKSRSFNFFNLKHRPRALHETVLVFSQLAAANVPDTMNYFPQDLEYKPRRFRNDNWFIHRDQHNKVRPSHKTEFIIEYTNYPPSVLKFDNENTNVPHPTQKPVALFEYLIRTYTQPGDVVLDPCVGSGTTAVAARKTGRRWVCGDSSQEYVNIALKRLQDTDPYQPTILPNGAAQLSLFAADTEGGAT